MLAPAERPAADRSVLLPMLVEVGELKRLTSAGRAGSIASRLFLAAWAALVAGQPVAAVMERTVAAALAAARLGDLDAAMLAELGLTPAKTAAVLGQAFTAVTDTVDDGLIAQLRPALGQPLVAGEAPAFAHRLAQQPRAGVTCPGKPRIVLQPAENHAEHCLMVATYGVLLAPGFGADPAPAFLIGLAHHLHNAAMPDSGFTGEMLLGRELVPVIERARERALDELAGPLRQAVADALEPIASDATAEARAFHAADAIDRVLETRQHLRSAQLSMDVVLDDYELVHDGPVKAFHDRVLAEVGLQ